MRIVSAEHVEEPVQMLVINANCDLYLARNSIRNVESAIAHQIGSFLMLLIFHAISSELQWQLTSERTQINRLP